MITHFLQRYRASFRSIPGFFSFDAALLFIAYNQLIRERGISGNVLEIGVHHGLSTILIASLRGASKKCVAIDLFDQLQEQNTSGSGSGNQPTFLKNMANFHGDLGFLRVLAKASADVSTEEVGRNFSFCHVDGGHSADETYHDLNFCLEILMAGGLLAVDDYFNPAFPGVSEGTVRFMIDQSGLLRPIAIGFNKVLFQKEPISFDLQNDFYTVFDRIPSPTVNFFDREIPFFASAIRPFFDIPASTSEHLEQRVNALVRAKIRAPDTVSAKGGSRLAMNVEVKNCSDSPFPTGRQVFGLSYHLLSARGEMLKYDNDRSYFNKELARGENMEVTLIVDVPEAVGEYVIELDLVWEGISWFKDDGNPTTRVTLLAN